MHKTAECRPVHGNFQTNVTLNCGTFVAPMRQTFQAPLILRILLGFTLMTGVYRL